MNDNDNGIEDRLNAASEQLIASFSNLDTEAELRSVRSGSLPTRPERDRGRPRRLLAVAAAVVFVIGGTAAIAVSIAVRSDNDDTVSAPSIATTPDTSPVVTSAPVPTEPNATETTAARTAATSTATTVTTITTEPAAPVVPVTTAPPATASDSTVPAFQSPSDVFVTVSGDRRAVIDVRNADGVVASFDLTCPETVDCVVESARVMGDTIWVAITDSEPGQADAVVRSRVVSVSRSSGDVVEQLSRDGSALVRSAGLGADGVLYAHFDGQQPADRQLVAIERGVAQVLATGVSGFRLSDDGRFLAVTFSNPSAGERARFEITDLVDQTAVGFQTSYINAGPAAWSPDGRYLIVVEQWEDRTEWIIDPWSGSGEPLPGTDRFVDGACFMDDRVIAHRTWNVGYGQGDAQLGVVRLTSLETGSTVGEIGDDLFGDGFRCHPDGSISYLRRPVVEVQLSPDFSQPEPDDEAPVDLVHIAPDGTSSVIAAGDLRLV
jgi:hypothetical protein